VVALEVGQPRRALRQIAVLSLELPRLRRHLLQLLAVLLQLLVLARQRAAA
jgi:hypothetical protein